MRRLRTASLSLYLTLLVTAALALNGCVHSQATTQESVDMHPVSVTLEETFSLPRQQIFDFIVAEDVLPKILTGYGPLPAVVTTRDVSGPWDQPGSWRHVVLADGNSAREEVTEFKPGIYFAYRINEFTFAVKYLATHAQGQWWFTDAGAGETKVRWTYTFYAKNALAALPLKAFAGLMWRGYMQVCLNQTRKLTKAN